MEQETEQNEKPQEYEVQYSQKWVNFTTTVKATSEEEAIKLSYEIGMDQFTVTTGNEEINSLEEIFEQSRDWVRATSIEDEEDSEEEAPNQ